MKETLLEIRVSCMLSVRCVRWFIYHAGNEDVRTEMASLVGNMTLPNNSKEVIARQGAKVFVDMVSKPDCNLASIQALHNLSTLDDNASVLLDSGALPSLIKVLFYQGSDRQIELKEFAALTIANMVLKPGNWELAAADNEGHLLQSELMVHKLVKILPHLSSKCQLAILQILCGILSSPQASGMILHYLLSFIILSTRVLCIFLSRKA